MSRPREPFLHEGPSFAAGLPPAAEIDRFRDLIGDENAAFFFDYWRSKCTQTGLPPKTSIDPTEIPKLLSAIFIEEWDEAAGQSRIRLAGEFHREPDKGNIQGATVDQLVQGVTNEIWKRCDRLNFFELRPTICGYSLVQPDKWYADLALPVRDTESGLLIYGYSWLI